MPNESTVFSPAPALRIRESPSLPLTIYMVGGLLAIASILTTNALLTSASILTLLALVRLLWRSGEPPALLFATGYQWLQVSTLVFVADYRGVPVSAISISTHVETAIWLSLAGVLVLGLGIALSLRMLVRNTQDIVAKNVRALSPDRVFAVYVISALLALPIPTIAIRLLPLAQFLYAIVSVKWIFYMILGFVTIRRKTKVSYFVIATCLELLAGIGFFAEFKTVLLVAGLVLLSSHSRFSVRTVAVVGATGTVAFLLGLMWMSIREDYRSILNQGTRQQAVLVSPSQRVTAFANLVGNLDSKTLGDAVQLTLTRLAYVDYFGSAIGYVPARRGYENGTLLWRAVVHTFVPRFIDPSKPILESDSEITMRYTGLSLASTEEGTSIGLGYMAETYIDFGPAGMFVPVFVFGLIWGAMYAHLCSNKRLALYGQASAAVLLLRASQFEIAEVKLLGGMISLFLILAVLLHYVMPSVHSFMSRSRSAGRASVPDVPLATA